MPFDNKYQMEIEVKNLKKTMEITKGIMKAAGDDILKPVGKNVSRKSTDRAIRYKFDRR